MDAHSRSRDDASRSPNASAAVFDSGRPRNLEEHPLQAPLLLHLQEENHITVSRSSLHRHATQNMMAMFRAKPFLEEEFPSPHTWGEVVLEGYISHEPYIPQERGLTLRQKPGITILSARLRQGASE